MFRKRLKQASSLKARKDHSHVNSDVLKNLKTKLKVSKPGKLAEALRKSAKPMTPKVQKRPFLRRKSGNKYAHLVANMSRPRLSQSSKKPAGKPKVKRIQSLAASVAGKSDCQMVSPRSIQSEITSDQRQKRREYFKMAMKRLAQEKAA